MKTIGNKTKTLVSSFVSLGVAASLIAGSTFALFTSETHEDIAITSGKVSLSATAQITKVYSAKWDEGTHNYIDEEVEPSGTYVEGNTYSFTNGGTAKYEGKTLTLNNLSAGDGVKFQIKVQNDSTISIKYQTVVTFAGGTSSTDAEALYKALDITVDEEKNISSNRTTAVSEWTTVPTAGGAIDPIEVDIRLPWQATDVQGMTCNIVIGVYAVQSNGHDVTHQNVYLINKESELSDIVENMASGDVLACADDVSLSADKPLEVPAGKDLVVDTQDNTLTVESGKDTSSSSNNSGLKVSEGSSLTLTGAEGGKVELNSAVNKPAVSVSGEGSTLNVDGAELHVQNEYNNGSSDTYPSAIVAEKGAEVNLGGNSVIEITGQNASYSYKHPQLAKANGEGSVVNINDTTVNATNATVFYTEHGGTINFNGGEINMKGGSCCAALALGEGAGNIVVSGGTINIEGEIKGQHARSALNNVVFAIGSTAETCDGGEIVVKNCTINLAPTFGIAIAVGGWNGFGENSNAYIGGNVIINLKATKDGKAYAAAGVSDGLQSFCIYFYAGTTINGVDNEMNYQSPTLLEDIAGGLSGMRILFDLDEPFPYA